MIIDDKHKGETLKYDINRGSLSSHITISTIIT